MKNSLTALLFHFSTAFLPCLRATVRRAAATQHAQQQRVAGVNANSTLITTLVQVVLELAVQVNVPRRT